MSDEIVDDIDIEEELRRMTKEHEDWLNSPVLKEVMASMKPVEHEPPAPILTRDGIRLHTGELITEGRVLDTLREAIRLLEAGDNIGFFEMVDVDKYEREDGWSEEEVHMFATIRFENGRDLIDEVDKIGETEEFQVYWESKNNSKTTVDVLFNN